MTTTPPTQGESLLAVEQEREAIARIVSKAVNRTLSAHVDPVLSQRIEYRLSERDAAVNAATDAILARLAPTPREAGLRAHIAEQITYAETRIQDGIKMGATVWRIALEDIARENRAALAGGEA